MQAKLITRVPVAAIAMAAVSVCGLTAAAQDAGQPVFPSAYVDEGCKILAEGKQLSGGEKEGFIQTCSKNIKENGVCLDSACFSPGADSANASRTVFPAGYLAESCKSLAGEKQLSGADQESFVNQCVTQVKSQGFCLGSVCYSPVAGED